MVMCYGITPMRLHDIVIYILYMGNECALISYFSNFFLSNYMQMSHCVSSLHSLLLLLSQSIGSVHYIVWATF